MGEQIAGAIRGYKEMSRKLQPQHARNRLASISNSSVLAAHVLPSAGRPPSSFTSTKRGGDATRTKSGTQTRKTAVGRRLRLEIVPKVLGRRREATRLQLREMTWNVAPLRRPPLPVQLGKDTAEEVFSGAPSCVQPGRTWPPPVHVPTQGVDGRPQQDETRAERQRRSPIGNLRGPLRLG